MTYPLTVKALREEVARFRSTPERARDLLTKCRDLIDALITCPSDAERVRIFKRFEKHFIGYSNLQHLAYWSSLANPSPPVLRSQARARKYVEKHLRDAEKSINAAAWIVHRKTGIPRKLARDIVAARYWSKRVHKDWPITGIQQIGVNKKMWSGGIVTGPKGSIPLDGPGSPGWIMEDRNDKKRAAQEAKKKGGH
jgi:hypothetical protein